MKVLCKFNDPLNIPDHIPGDFNYGLEVGKTYLVMATVKYKDTDIVYLLIDENGHPNWFPHLIFDIVDARIYDWYIGLGANGKTSFITFIAGFKELIEDEEFYSKLIDRDEKSLRTYFVRKIELEKALGE